MGRAAFFQASSPVKPGGLKLGRAQALGLFSVVKPRVLSSLPQAFENTNNANISSPILWIWKGLKPKFKFLEQTISN